MYDGRLNLTTQVVAEVKKAVVGKDEVVVKLLLAILYRAGQLPGALQFADRFHKFKIIHQAGVLKDFTQLLKQQRLFEAVQQIAHQQLDFKIIGQSARLHTAHKRIEGHPAHPFIQVVESFF